MTAGTGPAGGATGPLPPVWSLNKVAHDDNQYTLCDSRLMNNLFDCKRSVFDWSTARNQQLLDQRGISFERVVSAVEQGGLLDVLQHPNQDRYSGQSIYVVNIEEYVYLVPFVTEEDGTRFLKTIIPSRKATRDYPRRKQS